MALSRITDKNIFDKKMTAHCNTIIRVHDEDQFMFQNNKYGKAHKELFHIYSYFNLLCLF